MTIITNAGSTRVQAIFLRGHARMFSVGMKHSQMTATQLRDKCAGCTGKKYTRSTPWTTIISDLQKVIDNE